MIPVTGKTMLALVAAGWLAEALASTNADIDAGVAAYLAGDSDAALGHYTTAEADLGERPEIHFDKGLALIAKGDKEAARTAFEHGTESEFPKVHASAEYELGNIELDAEAFDAAIERYIKCLKLQPEHANAKWNLELALLKKQQKEDEEKKKKEEEEKKKDENKDEEKKDEEKKDEDKKDEEKKDEEKKDEPKPDEEKKDEEKKDEPKSDEQKQDEEKKDEQKQDEQKKDEQKPEEQKGQPQPQPQPLDKADLDKALEQLDEEDQFQLGRPQGRQVPVEKDW